VTLNQPKTGVDPTSEILCISKVIQTVSDIILV